VTLPQDIPRGADRQARQLRIGLNLLHALPEIGGGWNYIANLVSALAAHERRHRYVAFATQRSRELIPDSPQFELRLVGIDARRRGSRVVYENTLLQRSVRRERLDCLHWFANGDGIWNAAPAVVTVYDLQPVMNIAGHSLLKRTYIRWRLRAAVRRAAWLLPISGATAQALTRDLRADPARCTVVPAILEEFFKPAQRDEVERFRSAQALPAEFFLYVANFYPHKNHLALLQAYRDLKTRGATPWPLVLRGDPGGAENEVHAAVRDLDLAGDVRFLERLRREELPFLYGCASALVFPSAYEGAGMPLVEAMACGCPVLASDLPVVREAAGDASLCFNSGDVAAIAATMREVQTGDSLRARLRAAGPERAKRHRPSEVVRTLAQVYEDASALGGRNDTRAGGAASRGRGDDGKWTRP
jgi:glycosyltransferase involved in cell wall biosynthesis